jgi:hypothetical protein
MDDRTNSSTLNSNDNSIGSHIGKLLFAKVNNIGYTDNQYVLVKSCGDKIIIDRPGYYFSNPLYKTYRLYVNSKYIFINLDSSINDAERLELSFKPIKVVFKVAQPEKIDNLMGIKRDDQGNPILQKNSDGSLKLIKYNEGPLVQRDSNGNPIIAKDKFGNDILDSYGNQQVYTWEGDFRKINFNPYETVFRKRDSLDHIRIIVTSLITKIINQSVFEQLKGLQIINGILPAHYKDADAIRKNVDFIDSEGYSRISSDSLKNKIAQTQIDIYEAITRIKYEYGIDIQEIYFGDVDYTSGLNDKIDEQKRAQIDNEIKIQNAQANLKVAKLEAQALKLKEQIPYDMIQHAAKVNNLNNQQVYEIIKRYVTKANMIILENGGKSSNDLDAISMAAYSSYVSKYGNQNSSNNQNIVDLDADNSKTK